MAVLILGAHLALGLFGKGYTVATVPMWLITLGYPAAVPKSLYIAVCRASGQITRAAIVLTACSSLEIAAAAAGGMAGGLYGLSLALLAVRYAEALGDHPAGAPHRLRPKPAPRHRLYLPTLMANDSVASPPPPCHISKPAWTFRR